MRVMAYVLQVAGAAGVIGGLVFGIITLGNGGLVALLIGVIAGLLLFSVGTALDTLADIAADVRRSADALERLKRNNSDK